MHMQVVHCCRVRGWSSANQFLLCVHRGDPAGLIRHATMVEHKDVV